MKRNWLNSLSLMAALATGITCCTAQADNKNFKFNSGGNRNLQQSSGNGGSSTAARSLGTQSLSSSNFKPAIKTLNGNLGQLNGNNLGTLSQNGIRNLNGIKLGTQLQGNPGIVKKPTISGLNGIVGSQGVNSGQGLNSQLLNSNIAKKLGATILHHPHNNQPCKIDPGFNKGCSPCWSPSKIGCQPWWYGCYSWCAPSYKPCYPIIYTQPILVPVSVPVVTEVATVGAVVEEKLLQVPAGATLTLQALDLGTTAGQVVLQFNQMAMPAMVNEWKNDAVTATLPPMGVGSPVKGEITIVKADGKVANTIKVEIIPAQPQTDGAAAAALATAAAQ